MTCKKFVVYLEDVVHEVEAYELSDKGWNGWACPGFTKDQAELVMTQLSAADPHNFKCRYDAEFDTFLVKGISSDPECFTSQSYETVDGTQKLYAIGAWAWVWTVERYEPPNTEDVATKTNIYLRMCSKCGDDWGSHAPAGYCMKTLFTTQEKFEEAR